jgi:hypothetical protein
MKHLTKFLLTAIVAFAVSSCSRSSDSNNDNPTPQLGTGSFTVDGTTYTGICVGVPSSFCPSGLDVAITPTVGNSTSQSFLIYNMPSASSGTFNVTDGYQSNGTCNLWTAYSSVGTVYASKSGTITKTGPKSFTFTCTVYYLLNNVSKTVTGQGTYTTQ